jgi:hypothetical protein
MGGSKNNVFDKSAADGVKPPLLTEINDENDFDDDLERDVESSSDDE